MYYFEPANVNQWNIFEKIKNIGHRRCTRKYTTPVLFALRRVVLLRSYIRQKPSVIRFASLKANKISLKPKGFNITLPIGKITL